MWIKNDGSRLRVDSRYFKSCWPNKFIEPLIWSFFEKILLIVEPNTNTDNERVAIFGLFATQVFSTSLLSEKGS